MDVDVGIVDEHTGFHVARGVDVQVPAAAGDASANVLAIVLEIEGEQRLYLAHLADKLIHVGALLHGGHKFFGCAGAYGHVVEQPAEQGPLVDHPIKVFLAGDGVCVLAGPACGDAKRDAAGAQEIHGVVDLVIRALATA